MLLCFPFIIPFYAAATDFGPLYRPNKPLAKLPTVRWGNPHEVVTMNTNKFFDQINGRIDSNGTYLYYTGDLSAPTLAKDLEPWRDLIPRVREQRVNVWVSQRGVVTHLHLDSYENFFVQLDGRKRMLLFPPNQEFNAPLYPFMHPSFGQAQPNITADDKARQLFTYKNLKNLTVWWTFIFSFFFFSFFDASLFLFFSAIYHLHVSRFVVSFLSCVLLPPFLPFCLRATKQFWVRAT